MPSVYIVYIHCLALVPEVKRIASRRHPLQQHYINIHRRFRNVSECVCVSEIGLYVWALVQADMSIGLQACSRGSVFILSMHMCMYACVCVWARVGF